jgi:hypothetical protein
MKPYFSNHFFKGDCHMAAKKKAAKKAPAKKVAAKKKK